MEFFNVDCEDLMAGVFARYDRLKRRAERASRKAKKLETKKDLAWQDINRNVEYRK